MTSEKPICKFSFSESSKNHRECISSYCTENDGLCCINQSTKKFLSQQTQFYNKNYRKIRDLTKKSDWDYLEHALINPTDPLSITVLEDFSFSSLYRLRFKLHKNLGKEYVIRLLRKSSIYLRPLANLWGVSVSQDRIREFERLFNQMVRQAEKTSVGAIYRLYDLCEGKKSPSELHFSLVKLLSLFFAFGLKTGVTPESISALVAKYQFFEEFSFRGRKFLKEFFGLSSSIRDEFYLSGAETHDFVNNLWGAHLQTAEELNLGKSQSLLHDSRVKAISEELMAAPRVILTNEHRSLAGLRAVFSAPMIQRYRTSPVHYSPVKFKSNFEAAYHPFKHQDRTHTYFGRRLTTIFDYSFKSSNDFREYTRRSMRDYMHMIGEIVQNGKFIGAQPNQFHSGVTFKFHDKSHGSDFGVIISCNPDGYSYLLTCF